MDRDPIVEEVHQIRDKLLEECHGDLDELMDRLKMREREDRGRIISLEQFKLETKPRSAAG